MSRPRDRRRPRRPDTGPSGALFYGLVALLTALFFVAAWATLSEESSPGPLAPERPTSTPPPTESPTRVPPSPTITPIPLTPTPAVVVVERRPPTQTPRLAPSPTPTSTGTSTVTSTPTITSTPTPDLTATPTSTATETPTLTPVPPPPTETPAPVVHVVRIGDTLRSIGERYGVAWQAIAAANGLPVDTVLQPEQRLVIPQG